MSQQSAGASPWEMGKGIRPRVISIPETARYIGRSRSHVYDLLAAGKIKAVKDGKRTLPILDTVDAHLDSLPLVAVRPSHPQKLRKETAT